VTGSEDGSVRVWDFSAVYSHIPHWHSGSIRTVSTGNGVAVATAGDDSIAHLWDITKEEFWGSLRKHTVSIRWSKISGDGTRLLTASPNRQVSVWDIAEQKFLYGLPAHQGSRIKCISATDDLKLAVICLFDSTVTLWNVETQEIVRCLQKWGQRDASVGHTSAVNELVMTKDGTHVITASKDATLRVWDVQTGECLHVLEEHMDSVVGLHLEEASNLLASYSLDQSLVTWDFQRGEKLSKVKFKKRIKLVALSSDRKIAAALEDGSISVVLPQKHQVKEIRMHSDEVTHLSFTEDGRYLISASRDCSLRVVDLIQERVCAIFVGDCGFTCFSLHHPTQHIVAGTDRGVVSFLDISVLPC
jgi:WD40 repeat protein